MRSSIGSIVRIALVVALAAGCSDVTQPPAPIGTAPSHSPSFMKLGKGTVGPPFNLPAMMDLPGGAHFVLGCNFDATNCGYYPVNAAALALYPNGLTLAGVPIP